MIRHRPAGSGHPYSVDTEQRWPVTPLADEVLTLGVSADARVTAVDCVLRWTPDSGGAGEETRIELARAPTTARGRVSDGGHLASAAARLARAGGGWQATTPPLRAGGTYRYRFEGRRDDGRVERTRWHDMRAARWQPAPEALVETGRPRALRDSVEILHDGVRAWRLRVDLPLGADEHVVGFGERFDALDHRGTELDAVVFEQYKSQGAERKTYLPMPFAHVVGGAGWGFHVDTTRRAWFDLGASDPGRLRVEVETAPDGIVDLRLFDGTPTQVLTAFLDGVGRAAELPEWVFGLWASGNEWNTQAEVMRQADLHAHHDIPVTSIVIEAWSDESTFTAFRDARYAVTDDGAPHRLADFDFPVDGAWPDPKGMVDELHRRGIRVHLWQIPLMKMRPHPVGQAAADARAALAAEVLIRELDARGGLRPYRNRGWWFPLALMPDLTDRRAADWWTAKRRYLVDEVGIDGFKTDGGEHAWGAELVYLDGRRGDEANNTFPVAYAAAYGRLLDACGKAPVTFSRAGFTGSQAHGAFWAGDENSTWQAFRWSMNAGLSAASCGVVYWGWDLAGFSGEIPDAELYVRAVQASTFVPIMQYHSEFNHHRSPSRDRTPWNIAARTGDDRVMTHVRRAVRLRERLRPYLALSASRAVATDRPLMRPLFFEWPDDPAVWTAPVQWLMGDDLLVAPVLHPGVTETPVHLPAGTWWDAWTGERVDGGETVAAAAPLDRIPVYTRNRALLPLFAAD